MRQWGLIIVAAFVLGACGGDDEEAPAPPKQKPAVTNQPSAPEPNDFEPAVRKVLGQDLVAIRTAAGQVTVETVYTLEKTSARPNAVPAPSEAMLQKVCSAVREVDAEVAVVIVEGDDFTPLLTCPPAG